MTTVATTTAADVRSLPTRIEALLDGLSARGDDAVSAAAEQLVGVVLELYGAGLERVVALLDDQQVRRLAADELVGNLLILHGLHPDDVDTRVQQALDSVRPYLGSHAGGIDYLGVDAAGVAHLRLEGSCDHCPSSSVTVQLTIERAVLEAAPEVERVEVEGVVAAPEPRRDLPMLQIQPHPPAGWLSTESTAGGGSAGSSGWQDLDLTVDPGELRHLDLGGYGVLLTMVDTTPYAYRDVCPVCLIQLSTGSLHGTTLTCGGCRTRYNIRLAGREIDGDAALDPLPLLPSGQRWRIAVPAAVAG